MEFVIIWFIVGLVSAKYSVPDIAAAVKGNPVPSHERRMERLRQTGADTSHQRQPGTVREALRATVDNAAERAAITRQAKHDGKLRSLEERREHIADSAYERQKAKAQRGSGIVGAFARARGLLSDLRERRTEGQAWRENARRESLPETTDLVEDQVVDESADNGEGPDNVVPLRRRDTDSSREPAESSEPESENPADTDELSAEQAQSSDGDPSRPTEIESDLDRGQDRAAPQERSETDNVTEQNGESAMTEQQSQPEQTQMSQQDGTDEESGPSYETPGLTATLQRTRASSAGCHSQVTSYDQRLASLRAEYTALTTQISGIETQIGSLQQEENAGEQIRRLTAAQEHLANSQREVAEQITHATNTLQAYEAAAAEFDGAHSEFSRQLTGQDFYMSQAGAGSKKFLSQG